ncbi:MAG: flagellar hook capping FlgD N-terminal domain-containing protein [Thermodesulfobacteriota bacterium]|nr:flagellar hook capping FlgD N-terminal domain-containing protein [Thermodesulfobacteriota bacterium]
MESAQATGNSALQDLAGSYVDTVAQAEAEKDPLGRDAFLQMLVAQLENQDPLNPMEGTEFTTQLAQYSTLEQQFNTNDNLEAILGALQQKDASEENLLDYIGKEVYGNGNAIAVNNGYAGAGSFVIGEPADVLVSIFDADGNRVRDIYMGQKEAGTYGLSWDGTDNNGDLVNDGNYTFEVAAMNTSGSFIDVDTSFSGTVSGIARTETGNYLQVDNRYISPDNITLVNVPAEE